MIAGSVVIGLLLWNYGVAKTDLVVASLYTNLAPVVAMSSSMLRWPTDPTPGEPKLILPGWAFARPISSFMLFADTEGCTTTSCGT